AIFFILSWLALRDIRKAGVLTSLAMVLILTYGHIYTLIADVNLAGIGIGRHRYLVGLLIVIVLVTWFILKRSKNRLYDLTQAINLGSILLVAIPFGQFMISSFNTANAASPSIDPASISNVLPVDFDTMKPAQGESAPDIYYIIFDTYSRADYLKEFMDHDNQPFVEALKERGFYVADCSISNYSITALSIASSLNMNYLDTLDPKFKNGAKLGVATLYPYLQQSLIRQILEKLGYRTISVESGDSLTELLDADEYRNFSNSFQWYAFGGLNPFETMVINSSVGRIIYDSYSRLSSNAHEKLDYTYVRHRNRILFEFDQLNAVPSSEGPKFVYVHMLAPHEPFVFNESGGFISRDTPFTLNADKEYADPKKYIPGYTGELVYLNQLILKTVDTILADSKTPPVIILQGDHGVPQRIVGEEGRLAPLNAYYLPGANDLLYETISPVNTFRVVLNAYFNANLPLLKDRGYFSVAGSPFDFTQYTQKTIPCKK
ncbi:MAG: LTA synthase family protein, partial [Anaerolineaceae bacterium]|nr:LTA synthase family protein [Anaerolineaceae bacterium]